MFIIIILSYTIIIFFDLKATYHNQDKTKLVVYFILMSISCAIGIASGYVDNMPSPATPIKQFVFNIMGR